MASVTERLEFEELSDEDLDYRIDDLYPEVIIGNIRFYASDIIKNMSPNDYEMIRNDFEEEVTVYDCDNCGCTYDNELDAECCCDIEDEEY